MDFQVDGLITKGSTGQVNGAEMAGVSDPSLLSELTAHARRRRKIHCHFLKNTNVFCVAKSGGGSGRGGGFGIISCWHKATRGQERD